MRVALGLVGTALLIVSVNLPILQDRTLYKLHGYSIPFWQYGDWFSSAALLFVVLYAFFLTLLRKYRFLWIPGVAALLIFSYIIITPLRAFRKSGYYLTPKFSTMSFSPPLIVWWLVPVLLLGPLLLIMAALWRDRKKH